MLICDLVVPGCCRPGKAPELGAQGSVMKTNEPGQSLVRAGQHERQAVQGSFGQLVFANIAASDGCRAMHGLQDLDEARHDLRGTSQAAARPHAPGQMEEKAGEASLSVD